MTNRPQLLVTIDTEPDDLWSSPAHWTFGNVRNLPSLQELLNRHGVRPTYLVSYGIAADPESVSVLRQIHAAGNCEIGTHLHSWETPPDVQLPGSGATSHPYLFQFPPDIQRRKFENVHRRITEAFGVEPRSYRAGKYGLAPHLVSLFKEFNYSVDTSVTPLVSWADDRQIGVGGPDYRRAPLTAYELDERDVSRPGTSGILEVPVSIGFTRQPPAFLQGFLRDYLPGSPGARCIAKALRIRKRWFRPFLGVPFQELRGVARWLLDQQTGFLNMMFHSSELIPNSQWCKNEAEVARFVALIEQMILLAKDLGCQTGMTLSEFADSCKRPHA